MAWQCKLFYYSCVAHLGLTPVFIVHELDRRWHRYFRDIVAAGGIVRAASSYRRTTNGDDYSPRNTAGTLAQAALIGYPHNDFIVLCDADMIFLRKISFSKKLAAEGCTNLNHKDKRVREAAARFGLDHDTIGKGSHKVECAVPHVIPVRYAANLAERWLEAIDAFRPGVWQASMYAFGFAILKLKLELSLTRFVALNDEPCERVGSASIIHYAYGDKRWNKRDYWYARDAAKVWKPTLDAPRGTILAEIISQIRQANDFYLTRNHTTRSAANDAMTLSLR